MRNLLSIFRERRDVQTLVALIMTSSSAIAQVPKEAGREIVFQALQAVYPSAFQNHTIEYHLPPFVDEEFGFAGCAREQEDPSLCEPKICVDYMAIPDTTSIWEKSEWKAGLYGVNYTNFPEAETAGELYDSAVQTVMDICGTSSVEQSTWGRIKSLFGR